MLMQKTNVTNKLNLLTAAAKTVLGDDFVAIPRFTYNNSELLDKTFADEKQLLTNIESVSGNSDAVNKETWIQSVSRVREPVAKLELVRIMAEASSGHEFILKMAQVPYRPNDSWLGFEFPQQYNDAPFNILDDTISLAVIGDAAVDTKAAQSVLIIDDWTEKIPFDEEVTGVAFHYNQASAAAPQSVIVAIEPYRQREMGLECIAGSIERHFTKSKIKSCGTRPSYGKSGIECITSNDHCLF